MQSHKRVLMETAERIDPPAYRDESKPHVSTLISYVMEDKDEGFSDAVWGLMALGKLWEPIARTDVTGQLAGVGLTVTGSLVLERDGVIGTLDGAIYRLQDGLPPESFAVLEAKARFSKPWDPPDQIYGYRRYMYQTKAYCQLLKVKRVLMPILHLNSRPPAAEYWWYWLEFSDVQIQENWKMLMNAKEDLKL